MATLREAREAYVENADYAELASRTKALAFITACRRLKILQPARSAMTGSTGLDQWYSVSELDMEIRRAESWLAANPDAATRSANPDVVYPDFTGFRG